MESEENDIRMVRTLARHHGKRAIPSTNSSGALGPAEFKGDCPIIRVKAATNLGAYSNRAAKIGRLRSAESV
jgi:hypothetical protein